ncbi:hypothetical protein J5839_01900, partial [Methanosarcinaceae archaeon]|nr:hypothetical protein [Methanosarcinaceae archaeon]
PPTLAAADTAADDTCSRRHLQPPTLAAADTAAADTHKLPTLADCRHMKTADSGESPDFLLMICVSR